MSFPKYGTAPIRCGKLKCKWRGYETDLASVPHKVIKSATQSVCPACGSAGYLFMNEPEAAAWKRNTSQSPLPEKAACTN